MSASKRLQVPLRESGPEQGLGIHFLQLQLSLLLLGEPFRPLSLSFSTWKTGKLLLVWVSPGACENQVK